MYKYNYVEVYAIAYMNEVRSKVRYDLQRAYLTLLGRWASFFSGVILFIHSSRAVLCFDDVNRRASTICSRRAQSVQAYLAYLYSKVLTLLFYDTHKLAAKFQCQASLKAVR